MPGVRWMCSKLILFLFYFLGTGWTLWTRTLLTTMQPASGKILHTRFLWPICWDLTTVHVSCNREPAIVKANAITAASEATCLLLSVDETVKNPRFVDWLTISIKTSKLLNDIPGPARVRTRWEVVCQEGWAEAGEDQCKRKTKQSSPTLTPLSSRLVWSFNTLMLLQ